MGEGPIKAAQICTYNKYQNELYYNICLKSLCTAFFRKRVLFQLDFVFSLTAGVNPPPCDFIRLF